MNTAKYSLSLRVLHWSMATLIVSLLALGFYMAGISEEAPDKYELYPLHKSLGMLVIFLLMIRLPTRWRGPLPENPSALAEWEQRLSHLVHVLLYVAMFTTTFAGYLMSSFYSEAHPIDMFGLFSIPFITDKSDEISGYFHRLHSVGAWGFIVLLNLHIAGVIKHRFFDLPESNILPRML